MISNVQLVCLASNTVKLTGKNQEIFGESKNSNSNNFSFNYLFDESYFMEPGTSYQLNYEYKGSPTYCGVYRLKSAGIDVSLANNENYTEGQILYFDINILT